MLMLQGEGTERLLVKGKKEEVMTVDGDQFRYFLLAGEKYKVNVKYIVVRKCDNFLSQSL